MSVWGRLGRLLQVLSAALAVPLQVALAEPLPHITPEAAYAEIARSAELRSVQIDGDFDAAKMQPPPGATLRQARRAARRNPAFERRWSRTSSLDQPLAVA
jgi:hypothetical protein